MQLLTWILGVIDATAKQKNAEVDSNKQYVSELLAILMQRSGSNQRRLAETGGIDTVLRAIARYKNRCEGYVTQFRTGIRNVLAIARSQA